MKHRLLYIAAGVALLVALGCFAFMMEIYDLNPQNWGPQGVELEEWARAWTAYRDHYVLMGMSSLIIFVVLILAGLWFDLKGGRRLTTHSTGAESAWFSSTTRMLFANSSRPVNSGVGRLR